MKTSADGLKLIEGFEGCVLHSYYDIGKRLTIGIGHLMILHESYPNGITLKQAYDILSKDVSFVENAINNWMEKDKITLTQNQFDALVDFGFNLGVGALNELVAHGKTEIPQHMPLYDHAGGKVNAAILKRREAEVSLWNKG